MIFRRAILIILAAALSCLYFSCEIINPEESIPSYIKIDKIDVTTDVSTEGSCSSRITDAWIYVDDQLVGAFELPAKFPVLANGQHTVTIKPGIKVNGISASRAVYPFYEPYTAQINLVSGSVITINPTLKYKTATVFEWMENFDDGGLSLEKTAVSDTSIEKTNDPSKVFEGDYSGIVFLDSAHVRFQCRTIDAYTLPFGDHPVFLELNYKTGEEVLAGLISKTATQFEIKDVLILNRTDTWKKIYINLHNAINNSNIHPDNFQVYFDVTKSAYSASPEILFDNIKLVHF